MESWMRELAFHKSFTSPDSSPDHLGSSGFWMHCHSKGKQGVTVVWGRGGSIRDFTQRFGIAEICSSIYCRTEFKTGWFLFFFGMS